MFSHIFGFIKGFVTRITYSVYVYLKHAFTYLLNALSQESQIHKIYIMDISCMHLLFLLLNVTRITNF